MIPATRIARHEQVKSAFDELSDDELRGVLSNSSALTRNGHATLDIPEIGVPVFFKLLPLTTLEMAVENFQSTANFFALPSCYQYRLGSYGFGAWREIEAHEIANQWILTGECTGYALLHGWRVVNLDSRTLDHQERTGLWGSHSAIHRRSEAVATSTHCVVLLLEHFPQNLFQRSLERTPDDPQPYDAQEVEAQILKILNFANTRGVLHMDPHLENFLTDGENLILSDWGLALSRTFDLDETAHAFLDQHQNYDRCTAITALVHAVTAHLYPQGDWLPTLKALVDGTHPALDRLPATVRADLERRGAVAVEYTSFYRRLAKDLDTAYPADELESLLGRE